MCQIAQAHAKKQKEKLLSEMRCRRKLSQSRHKCKGISLSKMGGKRMNKKLVQCQELHNIFLNLNLEDKVSLEAEGNDRVVL